MKSLGTMLLVLLAFVALPAVAYFAWKEAKKNSPAEQAAAAQKAEADAAAAAAARNATPSGGGGNDFSNIASAGLNFASNLFGGLNLNF